MRIEGKNHTCVTNHINQQTEIIGKTVCDIYKFDIQTKGNSKKNNLFYDASCKKERRKIHMLVIFIAFQICSDFMRKSREKYV